MTKFAQNPGQAWMQGGPFDLASMSKTQMGPMIEAMQGLGKNPMGPMIEAQSKIAKQMQDLGAALMESVQKAAESNGELANKLSKCKDPNEAATMCSEFMQTSAQTWMSSGQRISEMWLKMCSSAMTPAAPSATNGEGSPTSATYSNRSSTAAD